MATISTDPGTADGQMSTEEYLLPRLIIGALPNTLKLAASALLVAWVVLWPG